MIHINNKLIIINSFKFLSFSLDSLVKNLGKNDFEYFLSQEFDSKVLDLVKRKGFYHYEYMSEKFKEQLLSKEKFCSSNGSKNTDRSYEHVLKVSNAFEIKTTKH